MCAAALLDAMRRGELDRTPKPGHPLDILAQQIVAACVPETWDGRPALRDVPPRVALPRSRARGLRRDGRAPHGRALRAAASRRRERTACARRSARASPRSPRAARSPTPGSTAWCSSPRASRSARSTRTSRSSRTSATSSSSATLVADPQGRAGHRARRRRARRAADDAVLARRGAGAHAASCRRRSPASGERGRDPHWVDRARSGFGPRPRAARRLPRGGRADARRDPDARARRARALLRRVGRHAARPARAVRRPHQPRVGAGAAQALLPRLRLRAAGRRQRRGDRALARAAAQLPARGRVRLPAPRDRARPARAGAARRPDVRHALALERDARAAPVAHRRTAASACRRRCCACAPRTCWSQAFPQVLACPETLPPGEHAGALGAPDRAPDDRGLPERGDGRRGLPRRAARICAPGASEKRRRRHDRAVGVRARDPQRDALRVPRRRAARGAPHAGGGVAAHARPEDRPTRSARSTPTRSRACATRRGPSPRAPRSCTKRCCGWATSPSARRGRRAGRMARRAARGPGASFARTPSGAVRWRAVEASTRSRRACCAAGSRRSARS